MVKFALNLPTKFLDDCKKLDLMGLIAYQPGIPARDFEGLSERKVLFS
jgi:hypothetical protein|nr:MAG TPA: hypothetical protein [Caudoviricetes sp.]